MTTETAIEIIEHIHGEFGVTVIYRVKPASVEFDAVEITARSGDSENTRLYEKKDARSSMEHVEDPKEGARYVSGFVKWDGCSHFYFGDADNEGYLHLCGLEHIHKLSSILNDIFIRCGQLMTASGCTVLEGEFPAS